MVYGKTVFQLSTFTRLSESGYIPSDSNNVRPDNRHSV